MLHDPICMAFWKRQTYRDRGQRRLRQGRTGSVSGDERVRWPDGWGSCVRLSALVQQLPRMTFTSINLTYKKELRSRLYGCRIAPAFLSTGTDLIAYLGLVNQDTNPVKCLVNVGSLFPRLGRCQKLGLPLSFSFKD